MIMSDPKTIIKWGATDYELVEVQDQSRSSQAGKLRKFDDKSLEGIEEYKYDQLDGAKKKIRLLQLKRGTMDSPDISCELVEANYDNAFHIPMIDGSQQSQTPSERDTKVDDASLSVEAQYPDITDTDLLEKLEEHKQLLKKEVKYEALSWCWGTDKPEYALLISKRSYSGQVETTYKLRVRKQLALALKNLRHLGKSRTMWIDAICIDQNNPSERNHQVQMMSRIYTRSESVCIWLGDSDDSSKLAIDFIRDEIMELHNFDALSKSKQYTEKWKALMMLMQREWFSRRWVVQVSLFKSTRLFFNPFASENTVTKSWSRKLHWQIEQLSTVALIRCLGSNLQSQLSCSSRSKPQRIDCPRSCRRTRSSVTSQGGLNTCQNLVPVCWFKQPARYFVRNHLWSISTVRKSPRRNTNAKN